MTQNIPLITVERALRSYSDTLIHKPDAEPMVAMRNALESSGLFFLSKEQQEAALWALDWILENPEVINNQRLQARMMRARKILAEEMK